MPYRPQTGETSDPTYEGRNRPGHEPGPPPATQPNPTGTANPYSSPDPEDRLGEVQRNSAGLLSTKDILDLAGLDVDKRYIALAARKMARDWDLSPQVIFGNKDPRKVVGKLTGSPVTMREALRFTDQFTPVAVAAMLSQALPDGTTEIVRAKDAAKLGALPVDVNKIGRFASVIARHGNMDLADGLGLAYQLAHREKFSAKRFEQNYMIAQRWVASSGLAVNEQNVAGLAIAASRKGQANTLEDFALLIYGKDIVEKSQTVQRLAAQDAVTRALRPGEDPLTQYQEGAAATGAIIPVQLRDGVVGPDYWQEVQGISKRVQLSQEAFNRSILGQAVNWTGGAFAHVWNGTQKALGDLGLVLVTPAAFVEAAIDPNSDIAGTWENIKDTHEKLYDLIESGKTVGWIVQEGYGNKLGVDIPDWVGSAIDFGVGWYVDPFALAGRAVSGLRAGRLLVENDATLARALVSNVTGAARYQQAVRAGGSLDDFGLISRSFGKRALEIERRRSESILRNIDRLGDSRLSGRLFGKLGDEASFFRELDVAGSGALVRHTLDYGYMKLLRDNLIEKFGVGGLGSAEARAAWNDGLKAHFLGYGPEGSVAESTVLQRYAQAPSALDEAAADIYARQTPPDLYPTESGLYLPSRGPDNQIHFFTQELPNANALGSLGPRRLVRRAFTSERFTESALGRRVASLSNINPGREMPLFGDGAREYTILHARRWNVFPEAEVQDYAARVLAIQNSGVSVEQRLATLMEEMNTQALRRITKPYNLTDEAFRELDDAIFSRTRAMNKRATVFGADQEGKAIAQPLLESQLKNFINVVDPIAVRRVVREWTGMGNRVKARLAAALRHDAPELASKIDSTPHAVATWVARTAHSAHQDLIHLWKGLTVARPGYIPRVILGDENLRFLATTSSGFERLAAQEFWGATRKLDDMGLFTHHFYGPDGEIIGSVGLPGAYERNAAANSAIRSSENMASILDRSSQFEKAYSGGFGWEVLKAKDNINLHLEAWTWDLTHQFPNSGPGRVALESVAAGDDIATTQARLIQWARDDHYVTLRTRIGVAADETGQWANDLSYLAHSYTMNSADIAKAALSADAKDVRKLLRDVRIDARPPVHGPTTASLTHGVDEVVGNKFLNWNYKTWVSNPENHINRQPFYKAMKRRGEEGMYGLLESSGIAVTDDIKRAINAASDEFALEQVNKVMFDLTKQSRFTELLQIAFPFPQPFFEGFQAWGHILRRNPEIVARAQALYRLGMETGMLKEDPVTGETVMPLGPVAWFAKAFAGAGGLDSKRWDDLGINFVAPLASFNMLSSTTVRFGPDGVIGKLIGGVPIPVPGLRPDATALFQWIYRNTTNEAAISYLFQYGPTTQFLPRTVQTALNALGITKDPYEEHLTLAILRSYQKAGIGFDEDGNPTMSEAELVAMAKRDARALAMARGLSALLSPASPRVHTTSTESEALFQTYIEAHPNDFQAALDAWHKDHPELWMVPVGKTYFDGAITDPRTGKSVTGPRLNASALVGRMLASPGIGDLMRRDKAWSGLLVLGLDPKAVEQQDFPTFAKLVADGTFRYKTPTRFIAEGVDSQAWAAVGDFYTTYYNPKLQALEDNGVDSQDTAYTELRLERQKFFAALYLRYPGWVSRNLKWYDAGGETVELGDATIKVLGHDLKLGGTATLGESGGYYDWAMDDQYATAPLALAQARHIASQKGFEQFPGIQALNDYLALRDDISSKMRDKGYSSITQDNASGLATKFAQGVDAISERVPGFDLYLSSLLGVRTENGSLVASDDLQNVGSAKLSDFASLPPEIRHAASEFDSHVEVLNQKAYRNYDTDAERSQRYLDLQTYVDSQMSENPKVVRGWWKSLGPTGRADWRENLVTKPPEFYTRWDWHVMGVNLSAADATTWRQIAEFRIGVSNDKLQADLNGTEYSTGDAYDVLNKWVAGRLKYKNVDGKKVAANPFTRSVEIANDWAFPFKAAGLAEQPGRIGKAWDAVIKTTEAMQNKIEGAELFGPGVFGNTDEQNAWLKWQQAELKTFILGGGKSGDNESLAAWAPGFKKQWYDFQEQLGDPLISSLVLPDEFYGPLGAVGYGD